MYELWVGAIFFTHVVLYVTGVIIAKRRAHDRNSSQKVLFLLLPIFGPLAGIVFSLAGEADIEKRRHLMRSEEKQEAMINPDPEATKSVPLEEALLINSPQVRRELMMNLLRSDPRKHLDLLTFARYNEDPETAHYATATLTEAQRQIQLDLQQMQATLANNPSDTETRLAYIRLMEVYANSGLLEGHLLKRQRMELLQDLDAMPSEEMTQETFSLQIRTCLSLSHAPEARTYAKKMLERWPQEEESWLEMLRVFVETHDKKGLLNLKQQAQHTAITWTHTGLERAKYFWGDLSEE